MQLTKPLLTPDKEIGLPAETQLVAQVKSVNDGGFVQLSVVSIIRDGQEMALPEGAVQLRGAEGSPLIARKYGDPGMAIANMDLNIALTAGLSRAAELINRPRSSSVITSTGGSAVTQETDDPDLLAGVMEGAFGALTEQIAERNQAALEEILERPVIWYLGSGTEVDVFINQTVAL